MSIRRRDLLIKTALPLAMAALPLAAAGAETKVETGPIKPYGLAISADFPFEKKRLAVRNSEMAYVDVGSGPTLLFLHGNPTSSYLWRNIIPYVVNAGFRAVAPDLIGMGDSAKPDIAYRFGDHASYLDAFIETLELEGFLPVVHDWGSALGMRYARLNPANIRGLVFMEAIIPPAFPVASLEAMGEPMASLFLNLRTEGIGEEMVLQQNFFVEEILPKMGVARGLTEAEMAHYRAPFPTAESRRPTLQWPREIPIAGEPEEVHDAVLANGVWLSQSPLPKLFFYAEPGALNPPALAAWIAANVPNVETRFLGPGVHYLQEDHPALIGSGIADWLRRTQR